MKKELAQHSSTVLGTVIVSISPFEALTTLVLVILLILGIAGYRKLTEAIRVERKYREHLQKDFHEVLELQGELHLRHIEKADELRDEIHKVKGG